MNDLPVQFSVNLCLPDWIHDFSSRFEQAYPSDEDKMRLALDLAVRNVQEASGGPFGAAIFDSKTNRIISVGVNRVVPMNNSTAHAEMMAFMLAQKRMQRFRLDTENHDFILVTSAQPCAMCYGACPWAGIKRIIIGATREDVEALTEFDEGPMPVNWIEGLNERGISMTRGILRAESREVFNLYTNKKGNQY